MNQTFPSLESDLTSGKPRFKNIAIVTSDITGPVKNGGVGTAYTHLAQCLANAGHQVTIVFTGTYLLNESKFDYWQERYWRKKIRLISLPEPTTNLEGFNPAKISYAAYLFLREKHFDIIHFPDMHGIGFYSTQAKLMGIAFENSVLCVILHGPTSWHKQGNKELLSTPTELQYNYLERKSIELADVLVSPSQYGLNWAREEGWALPKRCFVEQYIFPSTERQVYRKKGRDFKEIVFFGRMETRKGIEIFCDALDLLPGGLLKGRTVTFLGVNGTIQYKPASEFFSKRAKKWKFKVNFIHDMGRDEALAYLKTRSSLVVLPSQSETLGYTAIECVGAKIPFIASRIPAFEELIDPSDHDNVLFDLDAQSLAMKIKEALSRKHTKIGYRVDPAVTASRWVAWHSSVSSKSASSAISRAKLGTESLPQVTVCLTHRNRAHYLEHCLKSLEEQIYKNFEVILVDDASDSKSACLYVDSLEKEFSKKGWLIIREPEQKGPCSARNKAASLAQGDYLLFMDDDNIAKPEELSTFVDVALRTQADILSCCFDRFTSLLANGQPDVQSRWLPMGDDLSLGAFYNTFGDMNSFFKRSVFLKLGGLSDVKNAGYEDYELFCRAIFKGYKLLSIPEALFFYRDHEKNYSKKIDALKTIEMRLKPFTDFFAKENLKPFFSFMSAMRFQMFPDEVRDPADIPPLFSKQRTDYFSDIPDLGDSVLLIDKKSEFKKLKLSKGTKITRYPDHAVVASAKPNAWVSIPLPKKISRRIFVEVDLFSTARGEWSADLQTSVGRNVGSKLGKINIGLNRLRMSFFGASANAIKLSVTPSDQAFAIRHIKVFSVK